MNANLCKMKILAALFVAYTLVPMGNLRAETVVFTIDSANSSLTLGGIAQITGVGTFTFGQQAAGSLVTRYSGSITGDIDVPANPGTISLSSASIAAAVNGQWQPNNAGNGLTPAADANYGIGTSFGVGKIRNLSFELSSTGTATVTAGQFPSSNQQWKHKTGNFDVYSPIINDGGTAPITAIAGNTVTNTAGNGSLSLSGNTLTLTLPVTITISYFLPGNPVLQGNYVYSGTIVATATVTIPQVVGSFVCHAAWSGGGSNVDTGKSLHEQGGSPQQLTISNLINTSQGINCIGFQVQDFPNGAAGLTVGDFDFQVSQQGTFVAPTWSAAPVPSISVSGGAPATVTIQWANNAIENRWLRVTVKATPNTGLPAPKVYYLGHLRGETGSTGTTYTVAFADITPIRGAVGTNVGPDSSLDIDKNGTVAFADISAMRSNVGAQLSNITVP